MNLTLYTYSNNNNKKAYKMHTATLVSYTHSCVTVSADEHIAYCARVSNPENQMNHETAPKLLNYLTKNKHWSPFEQANMGVEVKTTLAIATQLLRHRSFTFQQFSQRYSAVAGGIPTPELRSKGATNRQSSLESIQDANLITSTTQAIQTSIDTYNQLVDSGVALETARGILPQCTPTTLYVNGSVRSWVHYLDLRMDEHTQKEHRDLANSIFACLKEAYPSICEGIYNAK